MDPIEYKNQNFCNIKSSLVKSGKLFEDPEFRAEVFAENLSGIEWKRPKVK